ncbi:MAG: ABC transporter substrate-binding protein [Gemmatimonadales bacterium]
MAAFRAGMQAHSRPSLPTRMGARISRIAALSRRLVAVAALAALAAGCDRAPASGGFRVVDDAGDTVALASPAERIVSLAPAFTELLFALGAGDRVVGRTEWCDWPAAARAVPGVGDGLAPNVEAIVARRPDLVLVYRSGANGEAVARLRSLGIPVAQFRPDGLGDFARTATGVGQLLGLTDSAGALVARLEAGLAAARVDTVREPLRVVMIAGDSPPIVIGRGSYLSELVQLAGAGNAFADVSQGSAVVSLEAIAARDPDLVLVLGSEPPAAFRRPEWRVVRAVREGRVVVLDGSEYGRPSPRAPEAARAIAARFAAVGP